MKENDNVVMTKDKFALAKQILPVIVLIAIGYAAVFYFVRYNNPILDKLNDLYQQQAELISADGEIANIQEYEKINRQIVLNEELLQDRRELTHFWIGTSKFFYSIGISLAVFFLVLMSILYMPYINEIMLGKDKQLNHFERQRMYPMIGLIFLAVVYAVINTLK